MTDFSSFNTVTFEYDTLVLPPPFCHRYTLKVEKGEKDAHPASLKLEYYDREDLSEEDIYEEGYTPQDDYKWQGTLPDVWIKTIRERLLAANWIQKQNIKGGPALTIRVSHKQGGEVLHPAELRQWEIFIQEIIQAIFEIGGKESPLHLDIVLGHNSPKSHRIGIKFFFAKRTVIVSPSGEKSRTIPWEKGQKLMKYIYALDYLPEQAHEKLPKSHDNYIAPGDGYWYDLSPEKEPNRDLAERKEKLLEFLEEL